MRIIFTRHGETKENAAGISMGQGVDGTLNETGLIQAQKLALRLRDENIQYIYTSDLKRAFDTAKEVAKFHPEAKLIKTPDLRERNLGIYEGGSREFWKRAMKESKLPFYAFKPEKGESYKELQERISNFFNQILNKHQNDSLLLVSHTGALTMLFLNLFKRQIELGEYEKFKPGNTAITICDIDSRGKCTTEILNSIEHI